MLRSLLLIDAFPLPGSKPAARGILRLCCVLALCGVVCFQINPFRLTHGQEPTTPVPPIPTDQQLNDATFQEIWLIDQQIWNLQTDQEFFLDLAEIAPTSPQTLIWIQVIDQIQVQVDWLQRERESLLLEIR